ncbi:MAG: response regulator transcription factor [Dehalococcoidales bacterium]
MEKLRIFLADWQVLFREGIHFILSGEEDMEVVGEDTTNEQALAFIETNPPQVAIFNAEPYKLSGVEVTRRVKQNLPEVAIILIMDSYNEELLFSAMKSGASACLTKDIDPEDMVNAIRKAAEGEHTIVEALFRPEIASRVINDFEVLSSVEEQVGSLLAHLTSPEADILRQIADGNSKEQVADKLSLSEKDISHKLKSALRKLVANDHKQMLIEAAQSGLPPFSRVSFPGRPTVEYITREEFAAFKESLKERFKSLSGEIG